MKLTELQSTYIQKSRLFLYPQLGIKRGVSVTPIQTHMTWQDRYTVEDFKMINTYYLREDSEFKSFEQVRLLGNPLFETFFELEDGAGAYVFDFSQFSSEYTKIVNGKYSQLNAEFKEKILSFFKSQYTHHTYIQSYLEPSKFMTEYADLFTVKGRLKDPHEYHRVLGFLQAVGELCSLPDLILENLTVNEKIINFDPTVKHITNTEKS